MISWILLCNQDVVSGKTCSQVFKIDIFSAFTTLAPEIHEREEISKPPQFDTMSKKYAPYSAFKDSHSVQLSANNAAK